VSTVRFCPGAPSTNPRKSRITSAGAAIMSHTLSVSSRAKNRRTVRNDRLGTWFGHTVGTRLRTHPAISGVHPVGGAARRSARPESSSRYTAGVFSASNTRFGFLCKKASGSSDPRRSRGSHLPKLDLAAPPASSSSTVTRAAKTSGCSGSVRAVTGCGVASARLISVENAKFGLSPRGR